MDDLLLLVHRIPYPPNKGDKIRSYHLMKHLAQRYRVHLATFVDDANDWQYADAVGKLCASVHIAPLHSLQAKLKSLAALPTGRPLSLDYYRDAGMQAWVDQTIERHQIRRIVVFSSAMAQFIEHAGQARRVIDFVDVDSDKWLQYAQQKRWPMSWLYRREGTQLLHYERKLAQACDASLFVSPAEAALFKRLAPESSSKTDYFSNGVDTDYFTPALAHANPYDSQELPIVFTGAMDYWPNIDAVQWFAQEAMPAVLRQHPAARFYIVGARPSEAVQALAKLPGVHVTGSVPDVRPYLAHARAAVAPLRIARGIQNKVLEAMAMGKTVVVSPQALEGISAQPGTHLLLAEDGTGFAAALDLILSGQQADLGPAARIKVLENYNWDANLARVDALLEPVSHDRVVASAAETAPARLQTAQTAPTAPSPTSP